MHRPQLNRKHSFAFLKPLEGKSNVKSAEGKREKSSTVHSFPARESSTAWGVANSNLTRMAVGRLTRDSRERVAFENILRSRWSVLMH